MSKLWLVLGATNAALGILMGAFAAHGLKAHLSAERLSVFQTGVTYHLYHALGLMLIGIVAHQLGPSTWLRASGWAMFAGIVLFSGSLYVLSVTGFSFLGAVTPFGGLAFVVAWALAVIGLVRRH